MLKNKIAILTQSDLIASNIKGYAIYDHPDEIEAGIYDLVVMLSYPHLVKVEQYPHLVLLNVHNSLLPKYRGLHAFSWAMVNGEHKTGFTLHHVVNKPDAGNIIAQLELDIQPFDDINTLFERAWIKFFPWIKSRLEELENNPLPAGIPQNESLSSYYKRRKPEDSRIYWDHPVKHIHNLIRAVAPPYTPGAFCFYNDRQLFIGKAEIVNEEVKNTVPGKAIIKDGRLQIHCAPGTLKVLEMNMEGFADTDLDIFNDHILQ